MPPTATESISERRLERKGNLAFEGRRIFVVYGAEDEAEALTASELPTYQSLWPTAGGGTLNFCRALGLVAEQDHGGWYRVTVTYGPGSVRAEAPLPYAGLKWHDFSLQRGSVTVTYGYPTPEFSGEPVRMGRDGVSRAAYTLSVRLYTYSTSPMSPGLWLAKLNTLNAATLVLPRHLNDDDGSSFSAWQALYCGVVSERRVMGDQLVETVQEWECAPSWGFSGYYEDENGVPLPNGRWPAGTGVLYAHEEADHSELVEFPD